MPTHNPTGSPDVPAAALISAHRFRLTPGACVLALVVMLALIHAGVGLGPPWGHTAALPT